MAESGFPGFEAIAWFGLLAPARTPQPVVRKLHEEAVRVIALSDVRGKLLDSGMEIIGNSPEEFAARIKAEIISKGKLVRASGAKAD